MTKDFTAKDIKNLSHAHLFAPAAESCTLLVACPRSDYSASRIAHAVEDVDAHVLNLNVTSLSMDGADGYVVVALRAGRRDAGALVRSLERYGYQVLDFEGSGLGPETHDEEIARTRAAALLRILEM